MKSLFRYGLQGIKNFQLFHSSENAPRIQLGDDENFDEDIKQFQKNKRDKEFYKYIREIHERLTKNKKVQLGNYFLVIFAKISIPLATQVYLFGYKCVCTL